MKLGLHPDQPIIDPEMEVRENPPPAPPAQDVQGRRGAVSKRKVPEATTKLESSASTRPSTPHTPPLIPLASHEQDYHKRVGFRLLVTLIILFSLANILFAIGLSLLLDINWAFAAILCSLAVTIGEAVLWTFVMVTWMHTRQWVKRLIGLDRMTGEGKVLVFELIVAWLFFFLMLGACVAFM